MIQSAMLVLLGFFVAALAVLLLAPAYRRRAERITTQNLKRTMPMTTAEIRADKDRIRAKSAMKIHRLHKRAEQSKLNEARQLIELNRRDARIYELEHNVDVFKGDLTETQNARRVMEQTINFRLPQIEARLLESKRLLSARDREMIHFVKSAQRHDEIIEDAKAFHDQQHHEIEKLQAALTLQQTRDRGRVRDPGFGAELALRSEMEALRSRNRDQTALIERLQTELVRFRSSDGLRPSDHSSGTEANDKNLDDAQVLNRRNKILADEVEALKLKLQSHEDKRMGVSAEQGGAGQNGSGVDAQLLQNEVKKLRAQTTAQSDEIESLTSELRAMGSAAQDGNKPVVRLTKRVLNAKIGALEKRTERQAETIARLRAELAASNERAARQAASYMKEMRQIGVGPLSQPYEVRAGAGRSANGNGGRMGGRARTIGTGKGVVPENRLTADAQLERARASEAASKRATSAGPEKGTSKSSKNENAVENEKSSVNSGKDNAAPAQAAAASSKSGDTPAGSAPKRKRLIDRISRRD